MAAEGIDKGNYPRYALFRGKRVRILYYEGDSKFRILERDDTQRTELRSTLTFLKPRKTS